MTEFFKNFHRYPKISILGDRRNEGILTTPGTICVQEKIDGAQFGYYTKDDVIYFCSHGQNLITSLQIEETGIPKHWAAVEPALQAFQDNHEAFPENLYVYAESTQKHRIKYDDIPGFVGYDVFNLDAGVFMHWSWAKTIIEGMGLPFVNVIGEFNVPNDISHTAEGIEHLKTLYEHSAYRSEGAEGIVIKRYDTQQFAKIVDDQFKEKVKRPRTVHNSDTEQAITEVYATPARIEKKIYDLRDDGVELDMGMMRSLFNLVINDIIEECGEEIDEDYGKFGMKTLGSIVARKCAPVLKDVIMRGG